MTDVALARRTLNRDAVVRAAADFADQNGIDDLTLTRVAQLLGVSLPALYNHVRSHSDCTTGIALHGLDLLAVRLQEARGEAVGDEAVRAVAASWRAFATERPGLYAAIHRQRWSGSPEQAAASAHLLSLLGSIVRSYGGDPGEDAGGAWALGAALHGFAACEAEGTGLRGREADRAFDHLVTLLCHGLRAAAAPVPIEH